MKLTIYQGDCLKILPTIPSESTNLVITSPPYWGLRDYGVDGQLGTEPTMEAYLDHTMQWVKEVWRVLAPTGSFVLNIGDCFIGGGRGNKPGPNSINNNQAENIPPPKWHMGGIYKTKQFLSVSSFAYCRIISETDFICRGEHIWCKPNVPSSIRSRIKHSHEKLFWFVKDADTYYFDEKPWTKKIKESSQTRKLRATLTIKEQCGVSGQHNLKPNTRTVDEQLRYIRAKSEKDSPHCDAINLSDTSCYRSGKGENYLKQTDTIEHSWRIIPVGARQTGFELGNRPISEHIAPFPEELIRPYITSHCPTDGVILDPFLGSGTVMRLAMENNRSCVGIELNPGYIAYAKRRVNWGNHMGHIEFEDVPPTPHTSTTTEEEHDGAQ